MTVAADVRFQKVGVRPLRDLLLFLVMDHIQCSGGTLVTILPLASRAAAQPNIIRVMLLMYRHQHELLSLTIGLFVAFIIPHPPPPPPPVYNNNSTGCKSYWREAIVNFQTFESILLCILPRRRFLLNVRNSKIGLFLSQVS